MENIISVIALLFAAFRFGIVIYVLSSWLPNAKNTKFIRILSRIVEPYLHIFRFIPPLGGIDFSPIIALFAFSIIEGCALEGLAVLFNLL